MQIEFARTLYPRGCGYRYETGGIVSNLRHSTSIDKVCIFFIIFKFCRSQRSHKAVRGGMSQCHINFNRVSFCRFHSKQVASGLKDNRIGCSLLWTLRTKFLKINIQGVPKVSSLGLSELGSPATVVCSSENSDFTKKIFNLKLLFSIKFALSEVVLTFSVR